MSDLVLLDLDSQVDAVAQYIEGWKIDEILKWMSEYGQVTEFRHSAGGPSYIFRSKIGLATIFFFTESHGLAIVRPSIYEIYTPRHPKSAISNRKS